MADDLVKAEVHAVRALRHGVARYAEHIRDATAQARREVASADRRAQEAVERCRAELERREQELKAARAALAQCRENCGGLQRQAAAAARYHAEAKQQLDRARKAAQMTASAQSDLVKVLQAVEAAVGAHSSVASSALASLDAKLGELPRFDLGHAVHNAVTAAAVTAHLGTAAIDVGRVAGNALPALNIATPIRDHSISEMVERQTDQEMEYVSEKMREEAKRSYSGDDTEAST